MSTYYATQLAVYQHLLARHAEDPTFRFSMRQSFSKMPNVAQGLFIGTEQSRYFAFTLWNIPVAFPGSAMDLIDYIIKLKPDGTFSLRVEFFTIKDAPIEPDARMGPNTLAGRDLIWELQRQPWPDEVVWVAAPAQNKMLQLTYSVSRPLPDVPSLLTVLDALLDATVGGIDAAIAAHAARTPEWIAGRYTEAQFKKMRTRVEEKCADLLASKFPPQSWRPRAYWCAQVALKAGANGAWNIYQSQGMVRPLFSQMPSRLTSTPDTINKQLAEVRPNDIVIIVNGSSEVLGVGLVRGSFNYDPQQSMPYCCPVDWVLTKAIKVTGTPFLTGTAWFATRQWKSIQSAYAQLKSEHKGLALLDDTPLPEVKEQIEDLTIEDEAEDVGQPVPTDLAYWWLNINPIYWKVSDSELGQEQVWTTHNEKGNKRNIYKYFHQVKPCDLIIGYETSPAKRVKVLLEIIQQAHLDDDEREIITFTVKEFLREELTREQLLLMPELAHCEPLVGGQGSLYKLTSSEFAAIVARARREIAPMLPAYTLVEAELDLFLTTADIQHLRAALKRKKNLIVQGPPGVGKTYVARRLAWLQMGEQDNSRVQLVQFHQSYSYEDFIRGWRPTEKGGFELANGVFVDFVRRAQHDLAHDFFFIIDEINRGNLSKIFGELLMLLESDKRNEQYALPLTYRKEGEASFYLPPNLYIIGTMNTADRSLALVDYALRRRFTFVDLVPMLGAKLVQYLVQTGIPNTLALTVVARVEDLNQQIRHDRNLGTGFLIGHSYFCVLPNGEGPDGWWHAIVDHDIAPLLREYWFDDIDRATKAIAVLRA